MSMIVQVECCSEARAVVSAEAELDCLGMAWPVNWLGDASSAGTVQQPSGCLSDKFVALWPACSSEHGTKQSCVNGLSVTVECVHRVKALMWHDANDNYYMLLDR